jgi:tRNA(Ile)-lysidine synthase
VTIDPDVRADDVEPLGESEFATLMGRCLGASASKRIAVGVSGGADSMALTLLADGWARERGVELMALTVDHGLRAESAREGSQVGGWLRARGISHQTLRVSRARPVAGIQNAARRWRFAAFDAWCRENNASPVLLAHTAEDQAETLWIRILADSGPDGLAAMRPETRVSGLCIARPLLSISKQRLVATCQARGQEWIEDPSNRDPRFTRVRLREMTADLHREGLGIAEALRITRGMAIVRGALDGCSAEFMAEHGEILAVGVAWFDGNAFAKSPAVFGEHLLSRLTRAIGGGTLPPRRARVAGLAGALRCDGGNLTRTLAGCVVSRRRDGRVWIFRELASCADPIPLRSSRSVRWDNRFQACWRGSGSIVLGPLGEDGWEWIKRNDPRINTARGLAVMPHAARLSIPVIRELDGTVSVPHFVEGDGVKSAVYDPPLTIGFCPDAEWIGSLIAPKIVS